MLRSVPLLALGLTLGLASACRQPTTQGGKAPEAKAHAAAEVQLPEPLPLPSEPAAASWIAAPSQAIEMVAPYSPIPLDPAAAVEQATRGLTEPALAGELARAIDFRAPFANVVLDGGEEVIRLSLRDDARESLAGRFAELEAVGEFGAVKLPRHPAPDGEVPRAGSREWLAWIDEGDGGPLVLANSVEGLVTARGLADAYGQQPIYFTAEPSSLPIPVDLPFSRVTGRGDLSKVAIEAQAIDGGDPFAELPISAGTLGGLLDGPNISAGVSGRYADHEATVREVISEVNRNVRGLPFLVRGIGEDLAAKLNTLLRTWDGRVLVGLGPDKHLRLAYGASDVNKSHVATVRLLQKVVDNVSVARNFMSRLPKVNLRRRVAKGDGEDIELFVLHEAFSTLPAELRALVDSESRLNVAMAWSERAGGGMIVVGPDAAKQLARWLDETAASASHGATSGQLLAASFAGDPAQLQPLLANPNLDIAQLLELTATGPKWRVSVDARDGGLYVIDVRTPGAPKIPRASTPSTH
ncbi:hypothetical protein [Enhygromyxa salina]|nr:hypothetical protein [Enhygromyxa salina]